ncbi:MAG TPA: class I SAM-dependent methyltransferase [Thermoanaerobaculia bacterium]|jgi:SAM-dependent methyltransferase
MSARNHTGPRRRLVGGLALLVVAAAAGAELRDAKDVVDRIQRECLRAYPPQMRAEMASGESEIPADVEADPEAQMRYLDKELEVEKGLFYPTLLEEALPPLERYVKAGTRFLDLGSGDGRVVFLANVLGAHATGIEWESELVDVSLAAEAALADLVDPERIELLQGDFFEHSWAGYDVIFYFDTSSHEHARLRRKLREELGPQARLIVGHEIVPFEGFELEAEYESMKVFRQPSGSP